MLALACSGCVRFGFNEPGDAGAPRNGAEPEDSGSLAGRRGKGGEGGGGEGGSSDGGAEADAGNGDGGRPRGDASDSQGAGTDAGTIEDPPDAGADSGVDSGASSDASVDPPDAGGDTTVYPGCPETPGLLFCDGLEDPSVESYDYSLESNATLTFVSSPVRSGAYSLRAATSSAMDNTWARLATEVLAEQSSGHAWMRFYNFVPAGVVVTDHFSVGIMSARHPPWNGFELRLRPDHVDLSATSGVWDGETAFPRDRWVCVELHVYIHPSLGVYEAYLDGALAVTSPPMGTVHDSGYFAAEVGIHYASPLQGPVEVYVDDFAVARQRIGCD